MDSSALDYEFIIQTDVVDCYSSIYTHSIAWAIHTKPVAKANRSKDLLIGNVIDSHIQDMRQGQTNGIPQGSVLMDFISEMVLGYAGMELTEKLSNQKVSDYRILRYRDDYRIFTNNSQDGEKVLKCLTEVMIELGLKLSPAKTKVSNQVVRSSIKDDKRSWMCRKQEDKSLQKHLLIIHNHSVEHPNAGSLVVSLGEFHKQIVNFKKLDQPMPLISIVVDIAYHNPRVYSICVAVLSKLLSFIAPLKERPAVVNKIIKKFSQLPNTGHLELWLQRICISFDRQMKFGEPLCLLICGGAEKIWNSDWISFPDLKNAVDPKLIGI